MAMNMASLLRRGLALRRWPQCIPRNGVAAAVHQRCHRGGAMPRDVSVHVTVRSVSAIAATDASTSRLRDVQVRHGPAVWDVQPAGFVITQHRDGRPLSIRLMSSRGRGGDVPRMKDFDSLAEMTHAVHGLISAGEHLSTRDIAAYWTEVPKFVNRRNLHLDTETANQMDAILCHTLEVIQTNIDSFHPRDLAQTAIALSKIMKIIEDHGDRQGGLQKGSPHQLLHNIFVGNQSQNKKFIMKELALAAMPMRGEFDARHLSNLIYAFGLARCALQFDDGRTTFDVLAEEALSNLSSFNEQELSNMLWAYANVKAPNPALFKTSANHIAAMDIRSFNGQDCSNIVWAYATLEELHPKLFEKVADHIVAMDIRSFNSQDCSNTVWAYATARESHPKLFQKVADHIIAIDTLESFKPQHLSNTIWAYATAEEPHHELFTKIADHIVGLDSLRSFNEQELSNTVWAYATARQSHPALFAKVADAAIERRSEFKAQESANLLWAFASNGQIDRQLFDSFSSSAAALIDECNEQELANVAWAYAVADVDAPSLFNDAFVNACVDKEGEFLTEHLSQLHQWNLWQEELKSSVRLPPTLAKKCHDAFVSEEPRPSALQDDVVSVLSSIGLQPQEEFLTERGYRLDALVEVNWSKIGVEVDGPTHFVARKPTGSTLLKHRQVVALDEIPVVSVPYWKWGKLGRYGKNQGEKQHFLRSLLRLK